MAGKIEELRFGFILKAKSSQTMVLEAVRQQNRVFYDGSMVLLKNRSPEASWRLPEGFGEALEAAWGP